MARIAALPQLKDPPSVQQVKVRPIFDSSPHRNRGMPGIARELPYPSDRLLVATLVALGQPQWSAEQLRHHPPARYTAVCAWLLVQDAAEGDKLAKEKLDYIRWSYEEMRKQELISDIPGRTVGFMEK